MVQQSDRLQLTALGILSACTLAFQIAVSRLFALQQFHHFSFLVVSLAVLGIGAGGTLLAQFPGWASNRISSTGFVISLLFTFAVINYLPFDSYAIAWDPRQIAILLVTLLAVSAPLFFYGWLISGFLDRAGQAAYLPYAVNFIGAGLGCLLALGALSVLPEENAYFLIFSLALLGAALLQQRRPARYLFMALTTASLILSIFLPTFLELQISPYKALSQLRLQPQTREILQISDAGTRINILDTPSLRSYPGLSLNYRGPLPSQSALFLDGEGPYPVTMLDPHSEPAAGLAESFPGSLAYLLRPGARALILQPGTGFEVLLAAASDAAHITISSPEPLITDLLQGRLNEQVHGLYTLPLLTIVPHSNRGTLQSVQETFNLIVFPLSDPYYPITSGAFSLSENYSLTIESLDQAFSSLEEDGVLVISRWLSTPPGDSLKTWTMLVRTLENHGVSEPEQHLMAIRSMRTAALFASPSPFTEKDRDTLRSFLVENGFDPIYFEGVRNTELNRYNQLPEDSYHRLFVSVLGNPEETIRAYDLNIEPTDDNQPFYHHFFRWQQTSTLIQSLGMVWQPFGGSGYLVLLILLIVMIVLGTVLTGFPIITRPEGRAIPAWSLLLYFTMIGAAFMLVEIPLLQRFTLLFDKPSYALSFILFTILLASGAGSAAVPAVRTVKLLFVLPLLHLLLAVSLPALIDFLLPFPAAVRVLGSFLILFPAGFMMGLPFALGLKIVARDHPGSIPLAFAVNGSFSGISGVAAAMLTLDLGIQETLAIGAGAYLVAAVLLTLHWNAPIKRPRGS